MMRHLVKTLTTYWLNEKGVVLVEWVGIAAVLVVAGILITGGIMQGADTFACGVVGQLDPSVTCED